MTSSQTTGGAAVVVQSVKKQATKTRATARKAISKVKARSRKAANRNLRGQSTKIAGYSDSASRLIGTAKSAFNDAYGWAGDSSKAMAKSARRAGLPGEYVNERSIIAAAVGLGVSVALGAMVLGYGGFGEKTPPAKSRSRRKG